MVPAKGHRPEPGELRSDMFDAEFTHDGDRCTFEVVVERLGLAEPALRAVAEIAHDIDLKEAKFRRPESAGIDHLIAGPCLANPGDEDRLARGAAVCDDLHELPEEADMTAPATTPGSLRELVLYFLHLGTFGFGGPIALVGYMQRDLVDTRRWYSKQDYAEGLALAQLAPGPLAAQLAIYLGWLRGGSLGATLVAIAFVMPSFLMVLALSWFYLRYEGLSWMQGAFYGIGAAVIAIIARSAYKLMRGTLGHDWLLWGISLLSAAVTAWTESEIVWLFLLAGVVSLAAHFAARRPATTASLALLPLLTTGLRGPAGEDVLWKIAWYFAEAGAFVFGSGLAIVPFLHGGVVNEFGWLTERQFLDAVAVAMITPGPVVITVAFIGYLVAGPLGATLAALGVFLPCYLLVIIPATYFRRSVGDPRVKAFVDGVTAAAAGAIAGAAFVLGRRAVFDVPTVLIALATLAALTRLRGVSEPLIIVGAGVVGVALSALGFGA